MIVKRNIPGIFTGKAGGGAVTRLIRMAQQEKNADAFILLMEQNRQSMLKVAKSYLDNEEDVADVLQDSILTCYEKLDTLKQPQFFKTWLIRIVINKCKDRLRQNREISVPQEYMQEAYAEDRTDSDLAFTQLMEALDEKYRTILVLYYVEGYNTKEIAELLGLNLHTVKSRLARAREQFAREYKKEAGNVYG